MHAVSMTLFELQLFCISLSYCLWKPVEMGRRKQAIIHYYLLNC